MTINKKTISVSVLIFIGLLVLVKSQFAYKKYSIELQTQKEIAIIEAKRSAEYVEQTRKELAEAMKEEERQANIDNCIYEAGQLYDQNWGSQCKARFLKEDCSLPIKLADSLDEGLATNKSNCYKRYSK